MDPTVDLTTVEVVATYANLLIGVILGVVGAKGMLDPWR